jgi:hypothetical protein
MAEKPDMNTFSFSFTSAVNFVALTVLTTGCALQEIELAESENIVIAEVVLRAGVPTQLAWLHRTRGNSRDPLVENATIRIEAVSGGSMELAGAPDELCVLEREDTEPGTHGSCYSSFANALEIRPAETYRLTITLSDGQTMTGTTTVPANFTVLRPAAPICMVAPLKSFDVSWTVSPGAWVYAAETSLRGIRAALQPHNISVNRDPLRLFGLSVSARDTAIVFPAEFGVFDRFDDDLTEAMAFLQQGLPENVIADVVVAAADRNYVNWERGGNFNPSGAVRVPSVYGAGTGVFGSLLPRQFQVRVGDSIFPPC